MIPTSISGDIKRDEPYKQTGTLSRYKSQFETDLLRIYRGHPSGNGPQFHESSWFVRELEKLRTLLNSKKFKKVEKCFKYLDVKTPIHYVEVFDGRIHHDCCTRVFVVISNEFGIGISTGCFFPSGNPVTVEPPISKLDELISSCKRDHSDYALLMNGM